MLDDLFAQIDAGELQLSGAGGLIPELIKGAVERGLQAELSGHLGYEKGDPAARLFENHRNGSSARVVLTEVGEVPLDVPGDRLGAFTPFLAFPAELRKVIYTTDAIESLNYQLRKIIKNRGHFPNDTAAVKLLWLAICNIEDKRARDREKGRRDRPTGQPRQHHAAGKLIQGAATTNWKQALAQLSLAYPERINPHL